MRSRTLSNARFNHMHETTQSPHHDPRCGCSASPLPAPYLDRCERIRNRCLPIRTALDSQSSSSASDPARSGLRRRPSRAASPFHSTTRIVSPCDETGGHSNRVRSAGSSISDPKFGWIT